jgi:AmmeMemoRadiSam system protein B
LGEIPIDAESVQRLVQLPQVRIMEDAHASEHSLEVQLPFLQVSLGSGYALTPMVVGVAESDEVAQVLEIVWGGPETLIVVSSDLSHYHDYATAQQLDEETSRWIEELDSDQLSGQRACGFVGIRGLLQIAARRGLQVTTLDVRNSGDTAGPRDQVVGYGAYVIHRK